MPVTNPIQTPKITDAEPIQVKELNESKLQEIACTNVYHDKAFLKLLKDLQMDARGDTLVYLRSFRDLVKLFTVKLRNVKGVFMKEILMVSESSHV